MKNILKPTFTYQSVLDIEVAWLIKQHYRLLFIDVDNTLVAPHQQMISPKQKAWIEQVKQANILIVLLSNNTHQRIQAIAKELDVLGQGSAFKPFSWYYHKFLKQFKIPTNQVVVIGDQLFTDILGANIRRYDSIYVSPLTNKDLPFTILSRKIEQRILNRGK